jgi:hypothetical protein
MRLPTHLPVLLLLLVGACVIGPSGTFCSLDIGLVNAPDVPNVGPIEVCTAQYPTCAPPDSESPGWQCCQQTAGSTTQGQCMPNDAAAYQPPIPAGDAGSE